MAKCNGKWTHQADRSDHMEWLPVQTLLTPESLKVRYISNTKKNAFITVLDYSWLIGTFSIQKT